MDGGTPDGPDGPHLDYPYGSFPGPSDSFRSGDPDPLEGFDWRMHRVDPRDVHRHMVRDRIHGLNAIHP